ncbi:MAG TPA: hypothetical protein VJN18_14870 [Polyangiaceae bacterium]|nr:hypothetical protein [Polyangiaceae bacterium]
MAHTAVFGDIRTKWERQLREAIRTALRQVRKRSYGRKDAAQVAALVRKVCPSDAVPELDESAILRVLKTGTITRGGGSTGKRNVDTLVDELLQDLRTRARKRA